MQFNEIKKQLNTDREEKLNDKQVRQVLELLEQFAKLSFELFKEVEL
jgi:hypothetical protein